jgi:anti-anti-sigma regulatory factor/anti-sigma regulatory factor (Ser/Thr protein kinase)
MMGVALRCEVERSFPVAVVRLSGTLDVMSAFRARAVLVKCLADQPTALVVDLAELTVDDDLVLTLFDTINRRAAEWPGAAILLAGPPEQLAAAMRRNGLDRRMSVFPSKAEAVEEARLRPLPLRIREIYLPARDAPAHARGVAAQACEAWALPEFSGVVQVIVSELVANAVVHARTLLELSLTLRGRHLHISVRDGDQQVVRPNDVVADDAENGRGLLVVGAMATCWGVIRTGDGKVVWATLRTG